MRFLVPVDGSDACLRGVDYVIANLPQLKNVPEIHLMNVQPALPNSITRHLSKDDVRQYHDDEAAKELAQARAKLDAAGLKYEVVVEIGDPAECIAEYSAKQKVDLLVLGTRALNSVAGVMVGSVSGKILREARVPVLLVK
jgi:nucleotide-binding universal stress UspA family protein